MTAVSAVRPAHSFAVFSDDVATSSSSSINKTTQRIQAPQHAPLYHSKSSRAPSYAKNDACKPAPLAYKTSFSIYNDEAEANKENIGGITQKRDVKGKGKAVVDDVGVCSKGNQASLKASSACINRPSYSRRALQAAQTVYSDAANDCDSLDAQRDDLWNGRKPFEPASPQSTTQTKAAGRAETIYDLPFLTSTARIQTFQQQCATSHVSRPNKTHADLHLAQRVQQQDIDRRVRELTESPLADVTQAYTTRGAFCNSPLAHHKKQAQIIISDVGLPADELMLVQPSVYHSSTTPVDLANTVSTLHLQSCRPAFVPYNARVNKPGKRIAAMRA